MEARYRGESDMVRQAQEAVMSRPNFAIDAIGDSDGEEEEEGGRGADDAVMDEVSASCFGISPHCGMAEGVSI